MHRAIPQTRRASTSSQLFPFPVNRHPTPLQIFHLPLGASQQDIKSRYYELVRVHHPDSPRCRHIPADIRHARFQSISRAYDTLKRKPLRGYNPVWDEFDRRRESMARRQRPRPDPRATAVNTDWETAADDRWKDWVMVCVGVLAIGVGLAPAAIVPFYSLNQTHRAAVANLASARAEAKEYGEERRTEIRRRVKEYQDQRAAKDPDGSKKQT